MKTWIELDYIGFLWACALIGLAIALSFWLKLKLEFSFLLSAGRALLQLFIMGSLLAVTLALHGTLFLLLALVLLLTLSAFYTAGRISKNIPQLLPIVWFSLFISTSIVVSFVLLLIIRPDSHYLGQYLIPLAFMVIGNSCQAAAIGGERLVGFLRENRLEIETHLCLGATGKEAIISYQREAIKAGLMPTINQMMLVGLITMPNLLGGQILAGVDPLNASSYQLLFLFMLPLADLVTVVLITEGIYRSYFNSADQLVL